MKKISLNNLRSLKNLKDIELKPITAIVGTNSSGKSTFIRVFPLLKQSVKTKTAVPILWFGDHVDFGDYPTSINKETIGETIDFGFEYETNLGFLNRRRRNRKHEERTLRELIISFSLDEEYIKILEISVDSQVIEIKFDKNEKIEEILINEQLFQFKEARWYREPNNILPNIRRGTGGKINYRYFNQGFGYKEELREKLLSLSRGNTKTETIEQVIDKLCLVNKKELYNSLLKEILPQTLRDNLERISYDSDDFNEINNLYIAYNLDNIIEFANAYINMDMGSIKYIKPVRANANRYYRLQGLAIEEIDPSGSNLPMVLHNMHRSEKEKFKEWTEEKFDFIFDTSTKEGHVSMTIKDGENGDVYNLADTGYGFSQILPIILLLWQTKNKKQNRSLNHRLFYNYLGQNNNTIVIEQPELHLHPALQAKLIDVFATIIEENKKENLNDIKIIFETHSETMVNRLGYLIAKGYLYKEDVNVLMFDKDEKNNTRVKTMDYSEKGAINDWPIGFFAPKRL